MQKCYIALIAILTFTGSLFAQVDSTFFTPPSWSESELVWVRADGDTLNYEWQGLSFLPDGTIWVTGIAGYYSEATLNYHTIVGLVKRDYIWEEIAGYYFGIDEYYCAPLLPFRAVQSKNGNIWLFFKKASIEEFCLYGIYYEDEHWERIYVSDADAFTRISGLLYNPDFSLWGICTYITRFTLGIFPFNDIDHNFLEPILIDSISSGNQFFLGGKIDTEGIRYLIWANDAAPNFIVMKSLYNSGYLLNPDTLFSFSPYSLTSYTYPRSEPPQLRFSSVDDTTYYMTLSKLYWTEPPDSLRLLHLPYVLEYCNGRIDTFFFEDTGYTVASLVDKNGYLWCFWGNDDNYSNSEEPGFYRIYDGSSWSEKQIFPIPFKQIRDINTDLEGNIRVLFQKEDSLFISNLSYITNIEEQEIELPVVKDLLKLYPVPFNSTLNIDIGQNKGTVIIYNLNGAEVKRMPINKQAIWDGKNNRGIDCPSGIYLIRYNDKSRTISSKALLLR